MKKTIRIALAGLLVVPVLALGVSVATGTTEAAAQINAGLNAAGKADGVNEAGNVDNIVKTVIEIMLFIIGAAAVIMLIWGGIRYTTSGGNSGAVTSAKNTILYAIIGLVIAVLAYAIVQWVFTSVTA